MLDKLTYETFSQLDDKAFTIDTGKGDVIAVELVKVEDHSERLMAGEEYRKPFSIVFRGPADSELAQETYKVKHAGIGAVDIHLVPIVAPQGSDEKWYEAVFN